MTSTAEETCGTDEPFDPMDPLPLPGKPVRGSQSGRPLMAALDLLGRRWTLRILWELRRNSYKFRDLQARCDNMSTSVLSTRLKDMQAQQLVNSTAEEGWHLTDHGRSLLLVLAPLTDWSERWARDVSQGRTRND
jgi:DNA-binding HxlR family transcriptional regulator